MTKCLRCWSPSKNTSVSCDRHGLHHHETCPVCGYEFVVTHDIHGRIKEITDYSSFDADGERCVLVAIGPEFYPEIPIYDGRFD